MNSMAEELPGMLMVWTDIPVDVEVDFNEWYNREHLPDRINKVPGFTRGRRFKAISGAPRYLALYEARSSAVMQSQPYLAINRNPDPLSRRFIPLFKNTIKAICDIKCRVGEGEGAFLALLPVSVDPLQRASFAQWSADWLLPEILQCSGIVAAAYALSNDNIVGVAAAQYTRQGDRWLQSLLMIEAVSDSALAHALARLNPTVLAGHGVNLPIIKQACTFQLLYTLHSASR